MSDDLLGGGNRYEVSVHMLLLLELIIVKTTLIETAMLTTAASVLPCSSRVCVEQPYTLG